jgi:O-antigen/teichoic acid export membrane protein
LKISNADESVLSGGFVNRFLLGVTKVGFAAGVSAFLSFLAFILAIRWVSKEEIGAFVLFRTIGGLFVLVADMGLGRAATRFIAMSASDEQRAIINATLWVRLLLSGIIGLIIYLAESAVAFLVPSPAIMRLYFYLPLFFLALSFSTTCRYILQGLHYYGHIAAAETGAALVNLALTCLFAMAFSWGGLGLVVAVIASETLSTGYQLYMLPWRYGTTRWLTTGRNLLRFGFPLQLNNFLTFLFNGIDPLLIGTFLNPISVAYFNVAARIPERCGSLLQAFISVYYPHMAELFGRERKQEAENFLNHSLRLLAFVTLFVALAVTLFQESIVKILFTAEYLPSASALALLMITLAMSSIGNPLGNTLVAAGYPLLPALINLVHAGIHTITTIVMIPIWGFMGAVYAALFSHAISIPVNVWVLRGKGVAVNSRNYLLPFGVFGACWSVWVFVHTDIFLVNVAILGMFVFLNMTLGIVTTRDISTLLQNLPHSALRSQRLTAKVSR